MFYNAKSVNELTKAVEKSLQIIKEYGVDHYQEQKLENLGMKRYNEIMLEMKRIDHERTSNRFKK